MLHTLIADFASALHRNGAPAHAVEGLALELLEVWEGSGSIVSSPTAVWLEVGDRTRVLRLQPGDPDLAQLAALYAWHARVLDERPSVERAQASLAPLLVPGRRWSRRAEAAMFALASGSAGWLIGGSLPDLVGATLGGLAVFAALEALATPAWRPLATVLVGTLAGLAGGIAGLFGATPAAVAIGSVIVVLPGLGMTMAVAEVSAGHWSSGSARLLGAFATAAHLAGGLALGAGITTVLPLAPVAPHLPGAALVVPVVAPVAFGVLLRATPAQIPVITGVSAFGFAIATGVGGPTGAGLAALAVGLVANALSRLRGLPALATSLPGILLLVPGSVGVRGIGQLLADDAVSGTLTAVDALTAAGALALGLLASHALLPARQAASSSPSSGGPSVRSCQVGAFLQKRSHPIISTSQRRT